MMLNKMFVKVVQSTSLTLHNFNSTVELFDSTRGGQNSHQFEKRFKFFF